MSLNVSVCDNLLQKGECCQTAATGISKIIDTAGNLMTEGLSWVGEIANTVMNNDLLLLFTCVALVMVGVNLFGRLRS